MTEDHRPAVGETAHFEMTGGTSLAAVLTKTVERNWPLTILWAVAQSGGIVGSYFVRSGWPSVALSLGVFLVTLVVGYRMARDVYTLASVGL